MSIVKSSTEHDVVMKNHCEFLILAKSVSAYIP